MREPYPMPGFVAEALESRRLRAKYDARPPYQRNDYVGWITLARRMETKLRRLQKMLDELEAGDRYLKMKWGS